MKNSYSLLVGCNICQTFSSYSVKIGGWKKNFKIRSDKKRLIRGGGGYGPYWPGQQENKYLTKNISD